MATSADYAKLGKATFHAAICYDNGNEPAAHHPRLSDDPRLATTREFPRKGLAKAWVAGWLHRLAPPETGWFYGTVERGTYQDASGHDGSTFLHHAAWEPDEDPHAWRAAAWLVGEPGSNPLEWEEIHWDEDGESS